MKRSFIVTFLCATHFSWCQISNDAYTNTMSGAQINYSSALSLFYNPSLACAAKKGDIGIGNTFYHPSAGINNFQIAASLKQNNSSLGVGLMQEGFQQFHYTTILGHYGITLDSTWNIGVSIGINSSSFQSQRTYTPSYSVALSKKLNQQVLFSLGTKSIQQTTYRESSITQSLNQVYIGVSYTSLNNLFTAYTAAHYLKNESLNVAICLYYHLSPKVDFYLSGSSSPVQYAFGSKIDLHFIKIVLGFHYNSYLGVSPSSIVEYDF